ncbi:GPI mannosyltransferase 2 [Stylophora pistillata]|uniref:GPI mannosyltransferase 2 n=2 Tax=Stylophora pistillata TaxID=50429 RepID=A0A2B4SYN0_STYPI|nr:GPI mannosyltransferase 2 [Stylophora pistillata]
MAFFPLFPWILRILVRVLHPLFQYFLNERSLYLAIGWMLNSTLFTLAAISLNKLTFNLFGSRTAAKLSSLLFCFNPASVFMSSLYTESLFSCLQFTAMYFLEQQRTTLVVLLFSLGCATRSNGVLSCGFLAHRMTKNYVSSGLSSFISDTGSLTFWHLQSGTKLLLKLVILNGIVLFPFIIFQLYGYYLYCIPPRSFLGNLTNSPWCDKLVPFSYSYIQDNYWNVGFLCYFEFKQIPNFALASPVIILSVNAVLNYCLNHRNIETVKNLGLFQRKEKSDKMTRKPIRQNVGITGKQEFDFYQHPDVFVYVVHLFFMTLFGFTSMHVQVTTRFVASASPVIYWYSAHVIMKETYCQSHRLDNRKWKSQLIIGYFLSYFFIGTALHCNFYPWT